MATADRTPRARRASWFWDRPVALKIAVSLLVLGTTFALVGGVGAVALYRAGRAADALAAFGRARSVLDDELGIEPCEELQVLQRRILERDPALSYPGLGTGS